MNVGERSSSPHRVLYQDAGRYTCVQYSSYPSSFALGYSGSLSKGPTVHTDIDSFGVRSSCHDVALQSGNPSLFLQNHIYPFPHLFLAVLDPTLLLTFVPAFGLSAFALPSSGFSLCFTNPCILLSTHRECCLHTSQHLGYFEYLCL
jgi:hypothetical protein